MAVKPPDELIERIYARKTVLFVGAGLSIEAGLPGWQELLRYMLDWSEEHGVDLADRAELESYIEDGDLLLVAEEMRERLGKEKFHAFMTERFRKKPGLKPTDTHMLLPKIPFAAALTSNYDKLLESAYTVANCGMAPHVFTHADYPELSAALRNEEFYVLKVHGTIDRIETVVLGRSDYREVMHANPAYRQHLENIFSSKTVFFLGFGLTDPDLLLLLDELRVAFKDYTGEHYALMSAREARPIEQKRWKRDYGIQIIPYQATERHPEVREFLSAISDKVREKLVCFGSTQPVVDKEVERLQKYLECIKDRCGTIRLARILSEEALSVKPASSLEDLFVLPAFQPEPTLQMSPLSSTEMAESQRARESEEGRERRGPMTGQDVAATTIKQDLLLKDLFSEKRYFVVLGEAGSGKTTLLQYIALSLAQGQGSQIGLEGSYIPVWIDLRKFAEELDRNPALLPLSFVCKDLESSRELELPMGLLRDRLDKGQCVVLFDGLDEIASPEQRDEVVKTIKRFTWDSNKDNFFVMTSRKEGYKEGAHLDPVHFPCYNLQPFSLERIKEFLEKWYRYRGETDEARISRQVEVLLTAIHEDENIADLAKNPLLLVLIAALGQKGELPRRRIDVYKRCVDLLLGEWRKESLAHWGLDRVKFSYLKGRAGFVGYWIHDCKRTSIGSEKGKEWQELASDLAEYIHERESDPNPQCAADSFLEYLVKGAGILEQSEEEGQPAFRFVHNAFLDYLAAYHIARQVRDEIMTLGDMANLVLNHLHDERWQEWTLLAIEYLKGLARQSKLVETILDAGSESEDILHRDKLLAGRLLAEDVEVDAYLRDRVFDALAEIARTTKVVELQEKSLRLLGKMTFSNAYRDGASDRLREIATSYKDGEPQDALRAAIAALFMVGLTGWSEAYPILEDILSRDDILSVEEIVSILRYVAREWPEQFAALVMRMWEVRADWWLDFKEWLDFEKEGLDPGVNLAFGRPARVRIAITLLETSERQRDDIVTKARQLAQRGSAEQREQVDLLDMRMSPDGEVVQLQNLAQNAQSAQVRVAAAETLAAKGARSEALSVLEQLAGTTSGSLRQRVARDLKQLGERAKALPIFMEGAYEIGEEDHPEAVGSLAASDCLTVAIPALIAHAVLLGGLTDWRSLAEFLQKQEKEELAKNLLLEGATCGELNTYSQKGIIQGLARIGCEKEAVGLCLDWLEQSRDQRQRRELISYLRDMGRYHDAAGGLQILAKEKIDDEEVRFDVTSAWVSRFWQEKVRELEQEDQRGQFAEASGEVVRTTSILTSRNERREAILGEMDRAL